MKNLTSYCRHKTHLSNLLFDTPEALAGAIIVHGEGLGRTAQQTAGAFTEGLVAAYFLDNTLRQDSGRFSKNVAGEAYKAITEGHDRYQDGHISHRYHGSWEYYVPGPFHKTDIDANPIDTPNGKKYLLSINAAYVGNQPEIDLAKRIGMENGIGRIEIERGWQTDSNRWTIPHEDVAALYRAFNLEVPSVEELFQRIRNAEKKDEWDEEYVPTVLIETDTTTVSLQLVKYSVLPHYEARNRPDIDITVKTSEIGIEGPARECVRYKTESIEQVVKKKMPYRMVTWDDHYNKADYFEIDINGNHIMHDNYFKDVEKVKVETPYVAGYEPVRMEVNIRAKAEHLRHDPAVKAEMLAFAEIVRSAWPEFGKDPYEG